MVKDGGGEHTPSREIIQNLFRKGLGGLGSVEHKNPSIFPSLKNSFESVHQQEANKPKTSLIA
jgi:hypothetical protein